MIYKRKNNKTKKIMALIFALALLLLLLFRMQIKGLLFSDDLKVLNSRESEFFIEKEKNRENIGTSKSKDDETKGIMIFTQDNSSVDIEEIREKFSGESIIAKTKSDSDLYDGHGPDKEVIASLEAGSKVEVLTSFDSAWYYVKLVDGDLTAWISEDMLRFPYTPKLKKDLLTDLDIEVYINSSDFKSQTENLIYVDVMRQSIYIFKNYSGKWDYAKKLECMTGNSRNTMLKGQFEISIKDDFVYDKSQNIEYKYLSKLSNSFDIRALPKYLDPPTKDSEAGEEEEPITRSFKGNIWLSESDAKWIYDNIDLNTKVIIK